MVPPARRARHTPGATPCGFHLHDAVGARPRVHADLGPSRRSPEDHDVAIDVDDVAHLEIRAGHHLVADDQSLGAIAINRPDERPVGEPLRHAIDDVDPGVVGVLAEQRCLAGRRVDLEDPHGALIAALHHHQQSVLGPVNRGHVLESGSVPAHIHGRRPVDVDEMERDVGVVGSRRRIRDRDRRGCGIGRIRDVPATDARNVHAGDEQMRAVGRPPVSALATHLLGGDELGETIRDLVVLRAQQHARSITVDAHHVQRAGFDVRDPRAGGIDARIDCSTVRGKLCRSTGDEVDDVDLPRKVERGARDIDVG